MNTRWWIQWAPLSLWINYEHLLTTTTSCQYLSIFFLFLRIDKTKKKSEKIPHEKCFFLSLKKRRVIYVILSQICTLDSMRSNCRVVDDPNHKKNVKRKYKSIRNSDRYFNNVVYRVICVIEIWSVPLDILYMQTLISVLFLLKIIIKCVARHCWRNLVCPI